MNCNCSCILVHKIASQYKIEKIPENSKDIIKIQFIRNPYYRVVSAFLHLRNYDLSLYNFLIHLRNFLNGQSQNYHIIPNNDRRFISHYILQKDNTNYDYTSKVENLTQDIFNINKLYKLNLHYNKKKYNDRQKNVIKSKKDYIYEKLDIYKSNLPNNYIYFYNSEIKQLVYNIYKEDIDYFDYDIDII